MMTHGGRHAAERGFAVAVGHCLDLEADISFAPVVEAVQALACGVEDLEGRPSAQRPLTLLDPEAPRNPWPFRLPSYLRHAVLEADAAGSSVIVLEVLLWRTDLPRTSWPI